MKKLFIYWKKITVNNYEGLLILLKKKKKIDFTNKIDKFPWSKLLILSTFSNYYQTNKSNKSTSKQIYPRKCDGETSSGSGRTQLKYLT